MYFSKNAAKTITINKSIRSFHTEKNKPVGLAFNLRKFLIDFRGGNRNRTDE